MKSLYHIVSRADWEADEYSPASLAVEGFVHYSFAHQWRLTQQRYYRGVPDLLLLQVEDSLLNCPLRVENGFPHGYGPLPRSAVRSAVPLETSRDLRVTLWSGISPQADELRTLQTDLVVLPELPFQPWYPSRRECGPVRFASLPAQAQLARESGIALLGGGLVEDRRNLACLWDSKGRLRHQYQKVHLPQEPGFWEADTFDPGADFPGVCDALGFPLGVQLCSDIQRPFGATLLSAQGAAAILVPRATESGTYPKWRLVFQALARLCSCYILSVNRPAPEDGVPLGGPSVVVAPDGEIVAEGTERALQVSLSVEKVVEARRDYPGYLDTPIELYARGWQELWMR